MSQFLALLVSGVSIGFVYGLIALGFVIIFKATRVVHFAHPTVAVLGAFVVARTQEGLGFWLAVATGIAAAALASVAIEYLVIRRARVPDAAILSIITLGIAIALGAELRRQIGSSLHGLGDPWGVEVFRLGGAIVPQTRVVAAVAAIVILIAFAAAFRLSDWGVAMRAASEDREAAALMGIRLNRVSLGAWALAGALATIAGVFFAVFPSGGVSNLTEVAILGAFPAAIIGGLDSPPGAVVGGLLVGVVTTLASGYEAQLQFLGRGAFEVVPFVLMLLVLLIRPSGLFGTKELHRV